MAAGSVVHKEAIEPATGVLVQVNGVFVSGAVHAVPTEYLAQPKHVMPTRFLVGVGAVGLLHCPTGYW